MNTGIFLTVKDLMLLTGCNNVTSAQRSHKTIRDCLRKNKRKLTIKEYCNYEGLKFDEIWAFLRSNNGSNNQSKKGSNNDKQ